LTRFKGLTSDLLAFLGDIIFIFCIVLIDDELVFKLLDGDMLLLGLLLIGFILVSFEVGSLICCSRKLFFCSNAKSFCFSSSSN
jgi:hypothetical protein